MVKCPNCGAEYENNVRFCGKCGTKIPEPVKKAPKKKKLLFLIGIPVLAALIVLGVIFIPKLFEDSGSGSGDSGGSGGGSSRKSNYLLMKDTVFPFPQNGTLYLFSKNGVEKREFGEDIDEMMMGPDQSFSYFLDPKNDLWFTDGKKLEKVAANADSVIPALNQTAAVLDKNGVLYLASAGAKTKAAEDVEWICAVSPDGKTVGYSKGGVSYYYNGTEHELGEDLYLLAISNSGRYIYFWRDTELWVQRGDDAESRRKIMPSCERYYLNMDGTQVLGTGSEAGTHLSENGGEAVKILSNRLYPLLPVSYAGYTKLEDSGKVWFIGCRDFTKICYFQESDDTWDVMTLDSDLQRKTWVKTADRVWLLDDEKTLIFIRDGDLWQRDISREDSAAEKLARYVTQDCLLSNDGSSLLYMDEDDNIMYVKRGEKAAEVFIDPISDAAPVGDSGFLILADDALWYTDGGRAVRVEDIPGRVTDLAYSGQVFGSRWDGQKGFYTLIICDEDDEDVLYMTKDGKTFSKVFVLE